MKYKTEVSVLDQLESKVLWPKRVQAISNKLSAHFLVKRLPGLIRQHKYISSSALSLVIVSASVWLIFGQAHASMANVYIAQTAAGNNNGADCNDAYAASWFNDSSNWGAGSSQIGPGTTVYLCGTITSELGVQGSGTSGDPITIDWEPGASLSEPYCSNSGCLWMAGASYITLNGGSDGSIVSTANGTELANQANGVVGIDALGTNNITIENLNVSDMYVMVGTINITGNTTDGSTTISGISSFTGITTACSSINGPGIPSNDAVTSIDPEAGTITLSSAATATAGGAALTSQDGCGNISDGQQGIEYSGSNDTITNNVMHDDGWALVAEEGCTDSNVTISDNNVYNNDHDLALTTYNIGDCSGGSNVGPIYVNNNHFHDYSNWDTPGDFYHHDGIHCYSSGTGGATGTHYNGLYIYDNTFNGLTDLAGSPDGDNMTAQIFLEGSSSGTACQDSTSSVYVFNNVASTTSDLGCGIFCMNYPNSTFNNTIIGNDTVAGACLADGGNTVENNVITSCETLHANGDNGAGSAVPFTGLDYNVYANGGENAWVYNANYLGPDQFSTWQSDAGGDAHSTYNSSAGLNSDGSLQAGSPAIGAGTNLTSICNGGTLPSKVATALCEDISGNPRPSTGAWDAGAYQYSSTPLTTVYVGQSTTGSGNGTDCSDSESATWFNDSSNWGTDSGQIGPGTTVYLCGTISTALTAQGSGTSGNPITIIWENGATLSSPNWSDGAAFNTNNQTYLTLNGGSNGSIQATALGTGLADQGQAAQAIYAMDCDGCTIKNLAIENFYVHLPIANFTGDTSSGSETVSSISSFSGLAVGEVIEGTGIPSGATIESLNEGASTLTLSQDATASSSSVALGASDETVDQTEDNAIEFSGSNFTIADNTIHDVGWALYSRWSSGDSNISIYGNDIYNVDHGLAATAGGSDTVGPVYVYDNNIHDYANWDTLDDSYHHDGLHCYATSPGANYTGLYIYDNKFGGNMGSDATAQVFLEGTPDGTPCAANGSQVYVFNNYATNTDSTAVPEAYFSISPTSFVYNNTIVGATNTLDAECQGVGAGSTFENNIISSCNQLTSYSSGEYASGSPNYNLYANGGSNSFVMTDPPSSPSSCQQWGGWYPFTDETSPGYPGDSLYDLWQPCTGTDANSVAAASADLNSDGSLQSDSPAIGLATNLTSLCGTSPLDSLPLAYSDETGSPLCYDISGTARPATGAWDAGAFENAYISISAPTNSSLPSISGATTKGDTLTATNGTWTNSPTSYTYQWQDCTGISGSNGTGCSNISGATNQTYTLASSDVGDYIDVVVTATNAGGSTPATSNASSIINPPPPTNSSSPTISGTTVSGDILTTNTGAWTNSPISYTYQWEDCNSSGDGCSNVASDGTSSTYALTSNDISHTMKVVVTATNAGGSNSATSSQTAVVIIPTIPTPTDLAESSNTTTSITLSWTAPVGLPSGCSLTNYTVDRGSTQLTNTDTTNSYADSGLSPSNSYSYSITANANCDGITATSSALTGSLATAVGVPSGLTLTLDGPSQIDLNWNAPTNGNGGTSNINDYTIYRAVVTGGVTGSFTQIATTSNNTPSFNDNSTTDASNAPINNTTYAYELTATDNTSNISTDSATTSTTTLTCTTGSTTSCTLPSGTNLSTTNAIVTTGETLTMSTGSSLDNVTVNSGGILKGSGTVDGAGIDSGGLLSPGDDPTCITVNGDFTLDGTYSPEVQSPGNTSCNDYDQVIVTGSTSTINLSGALDPDFLDSFVPNVGQTFTVINNQTGNTIAGTFSGLPEGAVFAVGSTKLQITYKGGASQNSVVLTVVNPSVPITARLTSNKVPGAPDTGLGSSDASVLLPLLAMTVLLLGVRVFYGRSRKPLE